MNLKVKRSTKLQTMATSDTKYNEKIISQLSPDSIRWMNKRKVNISHRVTSHILPSRIEELRKVYESVDYNNTGLIKVGLFRDAVNHYNFQNSKRDEFLSDRRRMEKFFIKMDANGDGSIDFTGLHINDALFP